jgi:hypothetical protein
LTRGRKLERLIAEEDEDRIDTTFAVFNIGF